MSVVHMQMVLWENIHMIHMKCFCFISCTLQSETVPQAQSINACIFPNFLQV